MKGSAPFLVEGLPHLPGSSRFTPMTSQSWTGEAPASSPAPEPSCRPGTGTCPLAEAEKKRSRGPRSLGPLGAVGQGPDLVTPGSLWPQDQTPELRFWLSNLLPWACYFPHCTSVSPSTNGAMTMPTPGVL